MSAEENMCVCERECWRGRERSAKRERESLHPCQESLTLEGTYGLVVVVVPLLSVEALPAATMTKAEQPRTDHYR